MEGADIQASQEYVDRSVSASSEGKVDKVEGKGLSSRDFTAEEKAKLAGIEAGAQKNVAAKWEDVAGKPDAFPPVRHAHEIADVSGLQGELMKRQVKLDARQLAAVDSGITAEKVAQMVTKKDDLDSRYLMTPQASCDDYDTFATVIKGSKDKSNGFTYPAMLSMSGETPEGEETEDGALAILRSGYSGGGRIDIYEGRDDLGEEKANSNYWCADVKFYDPKGALDFSLRRRLYDVDQSIARIYSNSHPNINVVGSPVFTQGNVSGFSANDYLEFTTEVNVGKNQVLFDIAFTTGPHVTPQQNILDSWCGLALAVHDSRMVLAVSSNGTSFLTATGANLVKKNTSYRYRIALAFDSSSGKYFAALLRGDGSGGYSIDAQVQMDGPLFPTATYWGGANPKNGIHHVFEGSINLSQCEITWNGKLVWNGYGQIDIVRFDTTAPEPLDTAEKILAKAKEGVSDAKITVKQGGVEKGSFTLNQAGEKTIELDAGGGGGGGGAKCLLFVNHSGSPYQHVQWTGKDAEGKTHTYKVTRGSTSIELLVDDVVVASSNQGCNTMFVPVDGVLTLDDNGYPDESMCIVDNAHGTTRGTIDTAGHHSVSLYFQECLEQSTPITMADGTTKPVCELHDGDKVMSVNPDTMQIEEDEVCACDAGCVKQHNKADVWTFADGTSVTTVKPHQFYNVRTGRMEYIADFRIGDEVRKADGSATALTGHETRYGVTYHNTLYTKRYNNYFAGGILAGNRHSVKWGWRWRQDNGEE